MKRKELLKHIRASARARGLALDITEGGSHTKVKLGTATSVIPRHSEINEITAKAILKQLGAEQ